MTEEMRAYFERVLDAYQRVDGGPPRVPPDPDAAPLLWQDEPDEYGYVAWRPLEKTETHDLDAIAPDLAPLHASLHRYFNSWWFAALEGQAGGYGVTLMPVLPGVEVDDFLAQARGRAGERGGRLDQVPIGVEANGLEVVVDNRTGEVAVEDEERGTLDVIAPSLERLIAELRL